MYVQQYPKVWVGRGSSYHAIGGGTSRRLDLTIATPPKKHTPDTNDILTRDSSSPLLPPSKPKTEKGNKILESSRPFTPKTSYQNTRPWPAGTVHWPATTPPPPPSSNEQLRGSTYTELGLCRFSTVFCALHCTPKTNENTCIRYIYTHHIYLWKQARPSLYSVYADSSSIYKELKRRPTCLTH